MNGDAFSLARWFDIPRYTNAPEDEANREGALNDIERFTAVGELPGDERTAEHFIVRTPLGAATVQRVTEYLNLTNVDLVLFDHVRNDRWERIMFWFNTSSVEGLLDRLRDAEHVNPDALFIGGAV